MRSIFALLAAVLYLILTMPVLLVLWIVGKINPTAKDNCSLHMVQWIFRVILRIAGIKVTVLGQEHVPLDQAVLYILNHRSIFDIVLTYARCPGRTGYIAKKELASTPLKIIMEEIHCLFLDREDARQGLKTILTAIDYVKEGISMFIFPEGTRCKVEGTFLPFLLLSLRITSHGCVPPMLCWNTAPLSIPMSCQRMTKNLSANMCRISCRKRFRRTKLYNTKRAAVGQPFFITLSPYHRRSAPSDILAI